VKQFADVRQGYIVMGIIFGALFAPPFIFTFFAVRERPDFQKPPEKFDWRAAFLEPFQVKTFLYALFMYLLAFVAADTLLVFQVISLPFYAWLSRWTSKRTGFTTGAVI
jgi:oligogalacturonide transporter